MKKEYLYKRIVDLYEDLDKCHNNSKYPRTAKLIAGTIDINNRMFRTLFKREPPTREEAKIEIQKLLKD